jgi:phosphoribosylformylglycinamidine synthase
MGAKGDLGIELDLDKVPVREDRMSAYEMMLSESQERMLMVLRPEKEEEAEAIFRKWGLDFAIVGRTTDDLRFRIFHLGREVANLPIKDLGDKAPEYDRPWVEPAKPAPLAATDRPQTDVAGSLLKMLAGPDLSSRRWVWEQYDTLIQGNSLQIPGGDAGVVRVEGHPTKALAFSSDVTPRYCEADPYEGGKQAVAECWRNLTATGAEPLAATDNLNFGNPERPEIMGQFARAVTGIGDACRALGFPIVSGNVSLYNETNGQAILPTPTIGGVGLIRDWSKMARRGFAAEGDLILLFGAPDWWGTHLGQSIYLRHIHGRADGPPPPVDLTHEKKVGDFVRSLIGEAVATAVHDVSDGGLAVALAEMAIDSGIGATVNQLEGGDPIPQFFGEDQGRYVVTVRNFPDVAAFGRFMARMETAGIFAPWIGTTGGSELKLGKSRAIPVSELRAAHESWFPRFMGT